MTAVTKMRSDEVALRKARMLIGGKWVDSASGEVLEVENPARRQRRDCGMLKRPRRPDSTQASELC